MADFKVYRLMITPQTWVRSTQRDAVLFRIPEKILIEKYPHLYKRKVRLEKYSQYKRALAEEAERIGFILPTDEAWIKFYLPVPPSWRKKKKALMAFEPHQSRPDLSNLYKAFEDALKKEDMTIWDFRTSKYWYNAVNGFIEVRIPDVKVDMAAIMAMQKPTARKSDILK